MISPFLVPFLTGNRIDCSGQKVMSMKEKPIRMLGQIVTYSPLAGIIYASFLNLSTFQHQVLMLLLLIWVNSLFLYKAWIS
jgi:hypothetical protein